MSVSLHVKLRELQRCGVLELRRDPRRHYFEGEGAYFFKDAPIRVEADVLVPDAGLGEVMKQDEVRFVKPHDVAWCPTHKTLLAYAPSFIDNEPPDREPAPVV